MYKKANIFQKLSLCGFMLLFVFFINLSVSQALNINCDANGNCKIYDSTFLNNTSNKSHNINIKNLQSIECTPYTTDEYTLHFKTLNGSGYIRDFNEYDCKKISQQLLNTAKLNDKSLVYKIHKANILQIWAARVVSMFIILLAMLVMFCKVEISSTKNPRDKSRLP